jgi:molybdopterin molybdotransferase
MHEKSSPTSSAGLSVQQAQTCVLGKLPALGNEDIALEQALGRVLAEDIRANRDLPPFDASAMDGYAARSADLTAAPVALAIIEDIKAGDSPRLAVASGQCARIMTGAPVPAGADTVVRVEDTRLLAEKRVEILLPVTAATDIRRRGENMRRDAVILTAGTEITAGTVGMLASVKRATVNTCRLPRVAILSTGDELEALDAPFDPDKIPDANSYALMAQVQGEGIEPVRLGIARDNPADLSERLRQGLEYDMLLVSGGTSVGVHDYVRPTLEALGVTLHFWRVEMRPGHPVAFGTFGTQDSGGVVFCLPGNPVSSMVCFEQFVLPALRRLAGHQRIFRRTIRARLAETVKSKAGRIEFIRVRLSRDTTGGYSVTPTGSQSSGNLSSMVCADALLIVPNACKQIDAGESVQVQLLATGAYQDEARLGEDA